MYNRLFALVLSVSTLLAATAMARGPIEINYIRPATRVLGLYDATDPDDHNEQVILKQRVKDVVSRMGLPFEVRNVNDGLPGYDEMRPYRAIITAYSDPRMKNAPKYLAWLEAQLREGKHVVILNNFGAYQNSDDEKWMDQEAINRVMEPLGVQYRAEWTDDPRVLRVVGRDPTMFFRGRIPSPESAMHYYWFEEIGRIDAHLVVDRNDGKGGRSAVVFTSARGGMALDRYLESADNVQQVKLERFLPPALHPRTERNTRVLFVVDPESSVGHQMEKNLSHIARYGRIQADFLHLKDFPTLRRHDLRGYGAVVIASYDSDQMLSGQAAADVERWVREDGGGFVALFPVWNPQWKKLLGVTKWNEKGRTIKGVRYLPGFFPGTENLWVRGDGYGEQTAHPVSLTQDTRVLARATDTAGALLDTPVLWERRHGKGRVVFRNDSALTQKTWRGNTLQMILRAMPVSAAPLINSLVYFVDDCPQPMWNVLRQPIQAEHNKTDTDFYKEVWWPDLMAMAQKFALKLTFVLVFSYDDKVAADQRFSADPFYQETGKGVPQWMAREAVRLGHEVGLHGYNHQSLVRSAGKTSKGWPTRESMVKALRLARLEWERVFGAGQAPFTYIAPNNHIHRTGKEAVKEAFPEIRVMAAQYLDEGDIAGQEFGVDPDVPHFMDMPRVSSEFYAGEHNNMNMLDSVMLVGAWTHFVHPDDVYDPDRNGGMAWAGLNKASLAMLEHMTSSFPWLRSQTARDAWHELVRYTSGSFHYEVGETEVLVHMDSGSTGPRTFLIRLDPGREIVAADGGRVLHRYPKHGLWILEGTGSVVRLQLTR
ncbi:MAG: hypothetical protein ACI9WU_003946 [Myxococcota bacterium]|jgi:hypothetical protein